MHFKWFYKNMLIKPLIDMGESRNMQKHGAKGKENMLENSKKSL